MSANLTPAPIAILGCGSIGRRHLRNLIDRGETNLVVYDPSPSAREEAQRLGVEVCDHIDAVIEYRPRIVFVCTPSHLHVEQAREAARFGAHLFIEKPLSHTLKGIEELARFATAQHLTTLIGCNMRFHPGPALLKSMIESNTIGAILAARIHTGSFLPRWRPQQDYHSSYSASPVWGGALLDCIHEIDLALWLLGPAALIASIARPAASIGLQTDGLAELLLEHQNGAVSSVHLNFVQRNYRRSIELIGVGGSLMWDFNAGTIHHFGPDGDLIHCYAQPDDWQLNQMYRDELDYFLSCVRDGLPTFNCVSNAAATLRIALQAKEHEHENGRHHTGSRAVESAAR